MVKYNFAFWRKHRTRPVRYRQILSVTFFVGFSVALANLVYSLATSATYYSMLISSERRAKPFFVPKHKYNCKKLIEGDFDDVPGGSRNLQRPLKNDKECWRLFGNCTELFENHYYPPYPMNDDERDFPLAYVLLVNEHLEQIELTLNAIYAPQNVYCIHVDFKSSFLIHDAVERLSSCFPNVFVPKVKIAVSHGGVSMLHAQRSCLSELYYGRSSKWLGKTSWKYVLLLQGHDFPLRTNGEIVEILKIHKGANDVELLPTPNDRFAVRYEPKFDILGFAFDFQKTQTLKEPAPHKLIVYKGSVATVLNRDIVKFALENPVALDFLDWLNDTLMPDELYWSTLNHNEFLKIPGGYPGRCVHGGDKAWISRFAVWEQYEHLRCNGTWRHSVCLFNCGDLNMLSKRPELFLNKFWMAFDSVSLDCVHELLFNRTYRLREMPEYNFDLAYYKRLGSVAYQEWRLENPRANFSQFNCVYCKQCSH